MTLRFEQKTGGTIAANRSGSPEVTLQFHGLDTIPTAVGGDYFDWFGSQAIAWVAANAPTYSHPQGTLYWNTIQIQERFYAQCYDMSVSYSPNDKSSGAYQITVDQTGGTVNVKAGTVIAKFGANAPANLADVPPTIGVQGDDIVGVDIEVESTKIVVMFRHSQAFLTRSYIRSTGGLVGYVNNGTFLGYAAGEAKYLGGNFTESNTESTAQYNFAISPNKTNFTVAGITITQKYGWDLLDPVFKDDDDGTRGIRTVDYFKTIRPAGREWKDFGATFGWGV